MNVSLLSRRQAHRALTLPLYTCRVPAGFPSPADDYIEAGLDLNEHLVKHPAATFYARASGHSMAGAGILDKALLVVDRAIEPRQGDIVIAAVDGELTCKILDRQAGVLRAASPGHRPVPVSEDMDCRILGVVVHAINQLCTHS